MNFTAANIRVVFFAGYLLCFVALNLIALLISLFYRKKLCHPSPRFGFIAAIVLTGAYCLFTIGFRGAFVQMREFELLFLNLPRFGIVVHLTASIREIELLFLGAGAVTAAFSIVRLFLIMRRVQK